jgi:hypothetical protein
MYNLSDITEDNYQILLSRFMFSIIMHMFWITMFIWLADKFQNISSINNEKNNIYIASSVDYTNYNKYNKYINNMNDIDDIYDSDLNTDTDTETNDDIEDINDSDNSYVLLKSYINDNKNYMRSNIILNL